MARNEACKFDFCRERLCHMKQRRVFNFWNGEAKENERQQNDDFLSKRKFDDENFHFSYIWTRGYKNMAL